MRIIKLIFGIALILYSISSYAQIEQDTLKKDQTVLIKMLNGDEYIGKIIREEEFKVILKMANGEFRIKKNQILSINKYNYKGKFGYDNPHSTRYYFSPSGIPIKKGEGYYQNIVVSANFVNYGITSNISIGGGFEFISLISGNPIWFFSPKIGFNISEKFHAGAGVFMAGIPDEGFATLAYGVFTTGDTETNATLGIAYGFFDGERTKYPVINFAATHRVRHNLALLTENYFIPLENDNLVYFGVHGLRIMSRKNAFDIGIILSSELIGSEVPALPYVGYARAF